MVPKFLRKVFVGTLIRAFWHLPAGCLTHSTSCHLNPDHLTCPKFKYNKKVGYSEAMNTKHLKCQYMQTVSSIGLVCRTESYDKNCYTLSQGLVGWTMKHWFPFLILRLATWFLDKWPKSRPTKRGDETRSGYMRYDQGIQPYAPAHTMYIDIGWPI